MIYVNIVMFCCLGFKLSKMTNHDLFRYIWLRQQSKINAIDAGARLPLQSEAQNKATVFCRKLSLYFGGDEGSRTPVRKQFHGTFSGRSRLLWAALPPCSLSRRQADTPTGQVRVMMRGTVNSFRTHGRHINDAFPGLWPLRFRRLP